MIGQLFQQPNRGYGIGGRLHRLFQYIGDLLLQHSQLCARIVTFPLNALERFFAGIRFVQRMALGNDPCATWRAK